MPKRRLPKHRKSGRNDARSGGRQVRVPSKGKPIPLNHLYVYLRSHQLEGSDPHDTDVGCWPITSKRVIYGWGNVTIEDWLDSPLANSSSFQEPAGLDQKAKALRIQHYQRIFGLEECKRAIHLGMGVTASLPATAQGFDAERGEIRNINSGFDIVGNHYVALLGWSDSLKYLQFINSWGKDWGSNGFGSLPYSYYENYSIETWLISLGLDSRQVAHDAVRNGRIAQKSTDGVLERMWAVQDPLSASSAVHCREIFDSENDERMGWAFATSRGAFLDVEDLFVRPTYRRRGYARRIAQMLLDLSGDLGLPLRLQVSFADVGEENKEALSGILRVLRMTLRNTHQRGIAYIALPGSTARNLEPIVIPEKPTLSRGMKRAAASVLPLPIALESPLSEPVEPTNAHSSEKMEEDPFWRREIERSSPSNEQLRAMIGKFAPPTGYFDDEELPY